MTEAVAAPSAHRSLALRYFGVLWQARTWLGVLWMLLGLPLGVATFTFLVTGFSLGLGLAITIVGIPLLIAMTFAVRALAALEGRLATAMIGAEVPRTTLASSPSRPGLMGRISANLRDSLTWRGLAFGLLRMPLGILTFTAAVTLLSLVFALVTVPFTYRSADVELIWVRADTLPAALICMAVGLVLAPAALHLLNAMSWLLKQLATVLLRPAGD